MNPRWAVDISIRRSAFDEEWHLAYNRASFIQAYRYIATYHARSLFPIRIRRMHSAAPSVTSTGLRALGMYI